MSTAELVRRTDSDGVATITLDSPANRNALSAQLRGELIAHLDTAIADDRIRVIVLTHTGTVFCSGMDLKESRGSDATGQGVLEVPRILQTIRNSPTPVVARLDGHVRAGGIGIVAACDIVLAADGVTFAFTEVRLGLVPAVISVTVLPRVLPHAAHELFLTGETFSAAHAAGIGLINRVVAPAALDTEVARYVEMLRSGSPTALAGVKQYLRPELPESMSDALTRMESLSAAWFAGPDGQEGMRAFAEKRPPAWVSSTAPPELSPTVPPTASSTTDDGQRGT